MSQIFLPGLQGPLAENTGCQCLCQNQVSTGGQKNLAFTPINWSISEYLMLIFLIFFLFIFYCRHKLKESDYPRRLLMCQNILQRADADPSWLSNIWTSDEANFNLNGKYFLNISFLKFSFIGLVNTKNVVSYAPKNQGRPENFSVDTV